MIDFVSLILGFVLIALVSGNNLSVCTGGIIASRITSRRVGILIAICGYISGILLQSNLMSGTIAALLPSATMQQIDTALALTIAIFIFAQVKRIPQSLSITFTAVLVGIDLAAGTAVNWVLITYILSFWILIPVLSFAAVILIMGAMRMKANRTKHVWAYTRAVKFLLIVTSFFVAFTLGSNTIGMVHKIIPGGQALGSTILGIIVGSIFLSSGNLSRVGNDIIPLRYLNALSTQAVSAVMVEIATIFGIPLSNTQTFISSVYGAGVSYKKRIIMQGPFVTMVSMWIITAIVGLVGGFLITVAL